MTSPVFATHAKASNMLYKVRHEYGGAITDFRGLYRGV